MKFYKNISGNFIISISTNIGSIEITELEYTEIMQKIHNKPTDSEGYQYRLRADNLEWELVRLPEPEPIEEYAEISDYENALSDLGVRFDD